MPRFTALPFVVEAHQWKGNVAPMPDEFRLGLSVSPDGRALVPTEDGLRPANHGDWIVRGSSGAFSVIHAAAFETMFQEQGLLPEEPVKRAYNRREIA